jgi:hypothetical protein
MVKSFDKLRERQFVKADLLRCLLTQAFVFVVRQQSFILN